MIRRFSSVFIILLCLLTLPVSAAAEQSAVGTLDRAPTSMQNETPFYKQCQLGSVVADAVREYCGADIALIPTGVLLNDLSTGDISLEQVERVFSEDQSLAIAQLTAAQLWALLNYAVSLIAVDYDTERIDETGSEYVGFLQISGITMTYDASAPAESRVTKLTLSDGTELSSENSSVVFCVAGTVELFSGAYGHPAAEYREQEASLVDALAAYIGNHSEIPVDSDTTRITVIGVREDGILGFSISKGVLLAGCALFSAFLAIFGMRYRKYKDEYG